MKDFTVEQIATRTAWNSIVGTGTHEEVYYKITSNDRTKMTLVYQIDWGNGRISMDHACLCEDDDKCTTPGAVYYEFFENRKTYCGYKKISALLSEKTDLRQFL